MEINAIILAGGKGTRLRPLTNSTPKPMLKIANKPTLERVIEWLDEYQINDKIITAGYKSEVIKNYFASHTKQGVKILTETTPLGTAGAVKNAQKYLSDTFIVASGDALSDLPIDKMLQSHLKSGKAVTLAVSEVENPSLYGVLNYDENGTVTRFIEKPTSLRFGNKVNMGIYIIQKRVLDLIPKEIEYDFSRDLFPTLLKEREINAYYHGGYWCDIGDKTSFYNASFYYKNKIKPHENLISENAKILGVAKNSIVGSSAILERGGVAKNCILLDNAAVSGNRENEIIGRDFALKIEQKAKSEPKITKNLNLIPISRP